MTYPELPESFEIANPENWRPVVDYDGFYEVSDLGRIRSLRSGKILSGCRHTNGYVMWWLSVAGVRERRLAHRVVAAAWIGPCHPSMQVDHIDGCRTNNGIANLRYLTAPGNRQATVDRKAHAFGVKNGQAKLSEDQVMEIRAAAKAGGRFWGARAFAKRFGVNMSQIGRAARGASFTHLPFPIREGKP